MPTPRSFRLPAALVALAGLLALVTSTAPGQPAKKQKKKEDSQNSVQIQIPPSDYTTHHYPYDLKVDYSAVEDGLYLDIDYNGKDVDEQSAPKVENDTRTFKLDFNGEASGEDVRARMYSKNLAQEKGSDTRYGLNFTADEVEEKKGGPKVKWTRAFELKGELAKEKVAEKTKNQGGAINAGLHYGHFPPYNLDEVPIGATTRMWILGKFANPRAPLRMYYDLPAGLFWELRDGKLYPRWFKVLTEPLKAEALKPGGEVPATVVQVVLFNHKGKVLHIMDYPH